MQRVAEAADAGVIDENVEPAERALDPRRRILHLMKNGHIARNHFGLAAGFDDGAGSLLECGLGSPQRTAVAPRPASLRAMAAPMPRPAPVTTATCPARGVCGVHIKWNLLVRRRGGKTSSHLR